MNKIIVGIPRALLYYNYKTLWLEFFNVLNVKVLISPNTNKEIIDEGSKYVIDEACLSLKVFMGHVKYLNDKVDYLFVPRISCIKQDEKVCTNFLALYDLVYNSFPNNKILSYNYDLEEKDYEMDGFIKVGKELGFSYLTSLNAYRQAKLKEQEELKRKKERVKQKLDTDNLKIMVVSHNYNLYDKFIGQPIIKYLEQENVTVILSDINNFLDKEHDCKAITKTIYWTHNKNIMAQLLAFKDKVDGIILVSSFPCGPDSLSNELIIRKIKDVPISYITVDNNSSDTGLITRLESFIDIIRLKKERNNENETNN